MAYKCHFEKKNGSRCEANAQPANGLCVFHDPARADEGRRARQTGGVNRTRLAAILPPGTPDNPLRNTQEVAKLLGESINQVRHGQLHPRIANTVGYLSLILLKALEQSSTEERLLHLEAVIGVNKSPEAELFYFVPAGSTPTTILGVLSSTTVFPITSGVSPNRFCQAA
jgi:hypothetical protein